MATCMRLSHARKIRELPKMGRKEIRRKSKNLKINKVQIQIKMKF
jgi:hypothetical protein